MKTKRLLLSVFLCMQTSFVFSQDDVLGQGVEIGQTIPINDMLSAINLEKLSENASTLDLTKLIAGKLILIDFWATWCGACIVEMPRLDELQKEFNNQLAILSVSHEEKNRLEKFAKKRPYSFTYLRDGAEMLRKLFPYRALPHTVLMNAEGKVLAITNSKDVTKEVIRKVINGEAIDLPIKKDNMEFDMFKDDYFDVDSSTVEYFVLQPGNPNIPGFTTRGRGVFSKRRISSLNTTIANMYMSAFQVTSRKRLVFAEENPSYDNFDDPKNRYCMDLIVAEKDATKLFDILKEELNEMLHIKARIEKREMDVFVLKKHDTNPFTAIKVEKPGGGSSRGDYFKMAGAPVKKFGNYLESHGLTSLPVIDETGIEGFYEFDFSYAPEDKGSFQEAMAKLGLKLEKAKRKIDMLVLSEEK